MTLYSDKAPYDSARERPLLWTQDISGGGLSFLLSSHANLDGLLIGSLALTTKFNLTRAPFSGKIVRCEEIIDNRFKISMEFVHMDQTVRSDIIRFCRLKHAELRNKWRNYSV
jgi:c-di-GMP-binding flagellar brake protein YcgR